MTTFITKRLPLAIAFLLGFSINSTAQCGITSSMDEDGKSKLYVLEFERIYSNPDLENGFIRIDFSLAIRKHTSSQKSNQYYIQIVVANGLGKKGIIPRKIVMNSTLTLSASVKIPTNYMRNATLESCVFDLSESDFNYLIKNDILSLIISDPIESNELSISTNKALIANQVGCIQKIASSL